ncbi:SET and MYND domain-containing protein 3 [Gryganskiella cystojenkinii]|nr:SET and MYND domain-containing protein 3 [Gryganskiella cystojenkinii]
MDSGTATTASSSPLRSGTRAKRNYRTKKRDDSDMEDNDNVQEQQQESTTVLTQASPEDSSSSLPYIQSQNAQNLGEVYPGLARLSFLDQEQDLDEGGQSNIPNNKARRRPLQQHQQRLISTEHDPSRRPPSETMESFPSSNQAAIDAKVTTSQAPPVPPITSPAALTSALKSQIEIKNTAGKGRGLFFTGSESLKSGVLVFKELGYCQVVNDASLSKVCSTCFKDIREEQGEEDQSSGSGGLQAIGQRKLKCQIRDWKLHHQQECQGIQKSISSPGMKEVWTKHTMETTTVRAICRLVRRRERVRASVQYKAENGDKMDAAQKQVHEVYSSGLDQKEDEWLDEHGTAWIQQYLNSYENERAEVSTTKQSLDESSQFAKIMAVVMSCVLTPKEDRHAFLKGASELTGPSIASPAGDGGFDLIRKLDSYGFVITNLETTAAVGLALYVQCMPFLNHSCVPNCIYTFKGSRVECRVIREVQPGEELTISYVDQVGSTKERQRQLKDQYRFLCRCPLCRYFPANPLADPVQEDLLNVLSPGSPLFAPSLDPKLGWLCPNPLCASDPHIILAVDGQLEIYNNVKLQCAVCGHVETLTQEMEQENREESERLVLRFVREMNSDLATKASGSRNFELAKFSATESTATEPPVVGGLKTVREPSEKALQVYAATYRLLTGRRSSTNILGNNYSQLHTEESTSAVLHRSWIHHLVRRLVQSGFDEAVSHKNWVFALERSLELGEILNETYVGPHPAKVIQSYYTCKIANLLANLLLEESTVEIEESDQEDDREDDIGNSGDEIDLAALRNAIADGRENADVGSRSLQDLMMQCKRNDTRGNDDQNQIKKQRQLQRRTQAENSKKILRFLKELIPKIEDASILQQFQVCWGKDGRLASRYRYQVDSLKQALHYAELPL